MISVLLSWIIISAASLIFGYGAVRPLYGKSHDSLQTADIYLVFGLMLINVYAEIFSLFYKVGILACFILFVLGIAVLFGNRTWQQRQNIDDKKHGLADLVRGREWNFVLICIVTAATLFWTVGVPTHYDTSLYHVQAIQWIEKYGVVPGLGNLHNRFAYNSAFMPLQALFGLKWMAGQSLHTVNGYICALAAAYAIGTNNVINGRTIQLSDLLKISTLIYIYQSRNEISSPGSDLLTMLLILYICTKWSEFAEKDIQDALPYTWLCVIGVWAVTVKLSAAVCILLAVYPAFILIRNKQWGRIICNVLLGLFVSVPWLIRNVVISGYLLYPYPQVDLFDVDWKMPASVGTYDAREIMVWGRGLNDVHLYEQPFWEWFPGWYEKVPKVVTTMGFLSGIILVLYLCYNAIKRKQTDVRYNLLFLYSIVALITWLFSAPLFRYGMVYLLIPICAVAWMILKWGKNSLRLQYGVRLLAVLLMVPALSIYVSSWGGVKGYPILMQDNYEWKLTNSLETADGIRVWYPVEGDQGSYDVFPCVPFVNMVTKLELRGDDLRNGFRIKEEYANIRLNECGMEW